jgi:hypothetical protein
MTTYVAANGIATLDAAQAVVDRHLVGCMVCGTNRPCGERREAEGVFLRAGRLPRRKPTLAGGPLLSPTTFNGFHTGRQQEHAA